MRTTTSLHSRAAAVRRRTIQGFTLIEVMITVAIIAILAAIAYPSYQDYVLRGHLVDATNGLSTMRADMERHFQDNRTYATVGTGATARTSPCRVNPAVKVGTFTVDCEDAPTATEFEIRAVGSGPTNGFTFTINQANVRTTTTDRAGWTSCTTGWMTKKGQAC